MRAGAGVAVRVGGRMGLAARRRGRAVGAAEGWVKVPPRVAGETDGAAVSLAEDHHLCEGERLGMRDRHVRRAAADGGEAAPGAAVELEPRRAAAADDLDVAPEHALRVPGAERLHRGFLGCEPASEVNLRLAAPQAVRRFVLGEDTMDEAVAVALDGRGDA